MATKTLPDQYLPATHLPPELPSSALHAPCDPSGLDFNTTDDLTDLQDVIGQPRALRALELGSEVGGTDYNIFVLGLPSSGRTTLSQEYLQRKAAGEVVPDDWCYVNHFDNPYRPKILRLPPGWGAQFRKDMQELLAYFQRQMHKAFESKEYIEERDRILAQVKEAQEKKFASLQEYVGKHEFILVRTPAGVMLTPGKDGQALQPEDVEKLSPEQRAEFERLARSLGDFVEITLNKLRDMNQKADQEVNELDQRTILYIIGPLIQDLKEKYTNLSEDKSLTGWSTNQDSDRAMVAYLDAVQADLSANAVRFRPGEAIPPGLPQPDPKWTQRYAVNVLVDNGALKGAPVVIESQPTYHNLLGRIEHEVVMGATRTDFLMIRPGALHRANGGYLILPVRDLLINPYAWEGLKRVLRDGAIRISELGSQLGLISTQSLDPEPVPLQAKVLLVGTPMLYHLLRLHDEDFAKLFKVHAEFATVMERNLEAEREYGVYVKSVLDDKGLPPFDRSAVARVIEYSARLAEDQHKLSTRFGKIADLVRESAYWAKKENQELVTRASVQRAIDESIYRDNLSEERLQEMISQDVLMIDVHGAVSGQINALSVLSIGDYSFGRPVRVTAAVYPGQGGVIDIERQAKLGGPVHTKGILILSGYLGWRYAEEGPLSLSASLTFEQSYSEIEGDSASAAELLALLSAIAEIPLRQDRAITGSVNQRGQIQAIGGVNEKIEGFYAVCKAKGLSGEQGVLIPSANQRSLMLCEEVVTAVAAGQFHIWPVSTIDQCLSLLTGCEPGERDGEGRYPQGSFNQAVAARLKDFARLVSSREKERLGEKDQENAPQQE
ncbi:MAG: AAA family ATPase [Anaerolineales bacterium]|jgi:lon-related putative ATP-dependent protease